MQGLQSGALQPGQLNERQQSLLNRFEKEMRESTAQDLAASRQKEQKLGQTQSEFAGISKDVTADLQRSAAHGKLASAALGAISALDAAAGAAMMSPNLAANALGKTYEIARNATEGVMGAVASARNLFAPGGSSAPAAGASGASARASGSSNPSNGAGGSGAPGSTAASAAAASQSNRFDQALSGAKDASALLAASQAPAKLQSVLVDKSAAQALQDFKQHTASMGAQANKEARAPMLPEMRRRGTEHSQLVSQSHELQRTGNAVSAVAGTVQGTASAVGAARACGEGNYLDCAKQASSSASAYGSVGGDFKDALERTYSGQHRFLESKGWTVAKAAGGVGTAGTHAYSAYTSFRSGNLQQGVRDSTTAIQGALSTADALGFELKGGSLFVGGVGGMAEQTINYRDFENLQGMAPRVGNDIDGRIRRLQELRDNERWYQDMMRRSQQGRPWGQVVPTQSNQLP